MYDFDASNLLTVIPGKKTSDNRLREWYDLMLHCREYARVMDALAPNLKERIRNTPGAYEPWDRNLGLLIAITDRHWCVRRANKVTNGALATFMNRMVIYDFDKNIAHPIRYFDVHRITVKSDVTEIFTAAGDWKLVFHTPRGRVNFMGLATIFLTSGGSTAQERLANRMLRDRDWKKFETEIEQIQFFSHVVYDFLSEVAIEDSEPSNL